MWLSDSGLAKHPAHSICKMFWIPLNLQNQKQQILEGDPAGFVGSPAWTQNYIDAWGNTQISKRGNILFAKCLCRRRVLLHTHLLMGMLVEDLSSFRFVSPSLASQQQPSSVSVGQLDIPYP